MRIGLHARGRHVPSIALSDEVSVCVMFALEGTSDENIHASRQHAGRQRGTARRDLGRDATQLKQCVEVKAVLKEKM